MLREDGKVKEIWGRQFRIVKNGLDEAEVFAFVGRLIEQNSELSSKLEHVDSLKRLAENAVIEATKQAKRMKIETRQEASEKAREIIIQAEEKTKAEAERIISEAERSSLDRIASAEQLAQDVLQAAEGKAKEHAEQIIAKAEQNAREQAEYETKAEAERIVAKAEKSSLDRIAAAEEKARAQAEELSQEKLSLAEQEAKDIIKAAEEKAEEIKRLGEEEASRIVTEARRRVEEEAALIGQEAGQRLPASGIIAESAIEEVARRVLEELLSNSEERKATQPSKTKAAVPAPADTVSAEMREQTSLGKEAAAEKESPALYSGTVELAILPPVATNKLLRLHRQLTKARQVKVMDVAGSAGKGVIIKLFLKSPTRLIDMLESLPEVREATAATKQSRNTGAPQHRPGKPAVRRIEVTIRK